MLARHGESLLNVAGVVNADPARDRGLSPRGEEEARALGRQLAALAIELAVTSRFPRAQQTCSARARRARRAARRRARARRHQASASSRGRRLAEYRAWKHGRARSEPFPGGESLDAAAARYALAYRALLERPERVVLVICHEIPVRYALNGACGSDQLDAPVHDVPNATPYLFDEAGLAAAAAGISRLAAGT